MQPTDENLISRVRQGDEHAFAELVRRHEYPVATLIRYSVANPQDAEDVLQETLLDAWIGIGNLRDPENARAWLVQVARNRCNDYFRSRQRREVAVESSEIEERIDHQSSPGSRHNELLEDVVGALEQAPEAERHVARLFYIDGFTIAEIADRHRCPEGTVKRQLFTARDFVRQALGVASPERTKEMTKHRVGSKAQPFPKTVPEIEITPLEIKPFTVDCREMRYWSIIPEMGQRTLQADYNAQGSIMRIGDSRVIRKAKIHNIEGVEIQGADWWHEDGWRPQTRYHYGRLLEDKVQWLGELNKSDDITELRTFMDKGYVWAFPDDLRFLTEGDLFKSQPDGSLITTREREDFTESAVGYFKVRIGNKSFNCIRIVGLEGSMSDEDTCVKEAFIADTGRMILMRHYCLPATALRFGESVSEDLTITVDGHTFSIFRYTITGIGCGIDMS